MEKADAFHATLIFTVAAKVELVPTAVAVAAMVAVTAEPA
jgi:hypothetical protein